MAHLKYVYLLLATCWVTNLAAVKANPSHWHTLVKGNKAELNVVWYESKPFVYKNAKGEMAGIEPEIIRHFQTYAKQKYNVEVDIRWIEASDFSSIITKVANDTTLNLIGASAFSISKERKKILKFTEPYAADISVLISSKNVPIVKDLSRFDSVFNRLTAITIKSTTFETDLIHLKAERNLAFNIKYIPSNKNILKELLITPSAFGYIDLPIYLLYYSQNPSMDIHRQNLLPVYREGYSFIMSKRSHWDIPFNDFFKSEPFNEIKYQVIDQYIDVELFKFFEKLSLKYNQDIALLTKEKELQYEQLKGKALEIEQESKAKYLLLLVSCLVVALLIIILILYRKVFNDNLTLRKQKTEIEQQQQSIAEQNAALEAKNQQLIALNEEKNNLIHIVAHNLRTPIQQVQGFAQLLLLNNSNPYTAEQTQYLTHITEACIRLNKMITKILDVDALEHNRVNYFPERLWLNEFLPPIVELFKNMAAKKEIHIDYVPGTDRILIWADPTLLTQVLENLLSNAIKFSYVSTRITIQLLKSGSKAQIIISDQGQGFSPKDKLYAFQKFHTLSAKPTGGELSTGLGLSIVKKFVQLMDGTIELESEKEKGATFTLSFDLVSE